MFCGISLGSIKMAIWFSRHIKKCFVKPDPAGHRGQEHEDKGLPPGPTLDTGQYIRCLSWFADASPLPPWGSLANRSTNVQDRE